MLDQYQITILLNQFGKQWNEQLQKTFDELKKTDLFNTISHTQGTNSVIASLKSPSQLLNAVRQIKNIPNVSLVYTKRDHLKEVSDAIQNGEFFKAFTLCGSLYESYGKAILNSQFNHKPTFCS
jgi:nitrate reductase NapAB chaperone NapD